MSLQNCVHRISTSDTASAQAITQLLEELKNVAIESRTQIGRAISFVVSAWRRDEDGSFVVQFSPMMAERLNTQHLSGIALLHTARDIAGNQEPVAH